jgi:DNA-binding response OmpR family regulator
MTQVLVVEFDEALRGTLDMVLSEADHYAVTGVTTEAAALTYLASAPEGIVAVCSNTHADHHLSMAFFAAVRADKRLRTQHQYVLLSTDPARIPPALRMDLKRLHAPILVKPFDVDVLLAAVAQAARRLTPTGPQWLLLRVQVTVESMQTWLLDTAARFR